jgi:hypothetical protein
MHAFKLSVTAGPANDRYPAGTVANALCLVDSAEVDTARDRALLALDAQGWESCTILDVALLPAVPDPGAFSPAMQDAYAEAKQRGTSVIVYPPA